MFELICGADVLLKVTSLLYTTLTPSYIDTVWNVPIFNSQTCHLFVLCVVANIIIRTFSRSPLTADDCIIFEEKRKNAKQPHQMSRNVPIAIVVWVNWIGRSNEQTWKPKRESIAREITVDSDVQI